MGETNCEPGKIEGCENGKKRLRGKKGRGDSDCERSNQKEKSKGRTTPRRPKVTTTGGKSNRGGTVGLSGGDGGIADPA